MPVTRADIVAKARSYVGTPWHHMGRQPGLAIDCAGVWICAGRDLALVDPIFDVPNYLMVPDGVSLLKWCEEFMGPRVPRDKMLPGHGAVIQMGTRPTHLVILGDYKYGGLSAIHANNAANPPRVIETRLILNSTYKYVAAFRFPGVED